MIGRTVGHYHITQALGSGGMGVVYQAEDLHLGRMVALKFLPPELTSDDEARRRLQREARAASLLDHPNICTIYEVGQDDDRMFIAMACYDGESLDKVVQRGPVPLDRALRVVEQVARGLGKAHAAGIIHRDIKPGNVIVTGDGVVKILDFGLAKLSGATVLTKSSQTPGTLAFMAPEQLRGESVGPATDIWALGILLFELLSTRRPFRGDYPQAVVYSILNEQPESLSVHCPDLPPGVDRLVKQMLRKDPLQRLASTEALLEQLSVLAQPSNDETAVRERAPRPREPIASGARFGPYEIQKLLGAGGMGEVYLARDTRLDRPVAIKVLSAELSENPDFHLRLQREAKTISQFTHPNICTLFDVGEQEGVDFLVMEHLEGETLADRIARGPIPLQPALKIATEIASALEGAHRQGVVHRDLKPGNIMLTKAGVKLLDFGLAKGLGSTLSPKPGDAAATPTQKLGSGKKGRPLTAEGALVGTLPYMAPEQLEGRAADARTDIFAFGAILYEMITGRRAFEGATQASLIASIMEREPVASSSLQPLTPRRLDRLIGGCIAKDADDRFQTAHDLLMELRWIGEEWSSPEIAASPGRHRRIRPASVALVAALIAVAVLGRLLLRSSARDDHSAGVMRLAIPIPPETHFRWSGQYLAISLDGRKIAASLSDAEHARRIFVRDIADTKWTVLEKTGGAENPVFSPSGESIAVKLKDTLSRVDLESGVVTKLAGDGVIHGGQDWAANGFIYFTRYMETGAGIARVAERGGVTEVVVKPERKRGDHWLMWPQLVADGRAIIFTVWTGGSIDEAKVDIVNLSTGVRSRLLESASWARIQAGILYYSHANGIMAVPFDSEKLQIRGDPRSLVTGVLTDGMNYSPQFGVSANGSYVYLPGPVWNGQLMDLHLARGSGQPERLPLVPRAYGWFQPAPDGRLLAVSSHHNGLHRVWTLDMSSDVMMPVSSGGDDFSPVWTPDGSRLIYASNRHETFDIYQRVADGSSEEVRLSNDRDTEYPEFVTPDGRSLVYTRKNEKAELDIMIMPLDGERTPRVLIGTAANESNADLSRDGRWITYTSDESGGDQVYVQPFPKLDRRWQVSTNGGRRSYWSTSGDALYFIGGARTYAWMRAPIVTSPGFHSGKAEEMSTDAAGFGFAAAMPDGRLLLHKNVDEATSREDIVIVLNWREDAVRK